MTWNGPWNELFWPWNDVFNKKLDFSQKNDISWNQLYISDDLNRHLSAEIIISSFPHDIVNFEGSGRQPPMGTTEFKVNWENSTDKKKIDRKILAS